MRLTTSMIVALTVAGPAFADVSLVERQRVQDALKTAKELRKIERNRGAVGGPIAQSENVVNTGEIALTDASGLEYFINTNITFTTSSSASGAASEASYTGPVNATTSANGTVSTTLNDAFDGYNTLCVSTTGATGPCTVSDPDYTVFNDNGTATLDASCSNRQVILNAQTIGNLEVERRIFVPSNDSFARWLNTVTNNGAGTLTVTLSTANNLGSDANTVIVSSSDGDSTAEVTDTWVTTFQAFSGATSSDVRLGHVLQGTGADTPLAAINFANGDDNPFWAYTFNLAPGETKTIMNLVTGQASRAAAAAKAAELATLPANALQCMSQAEQDQVVNFTLGPTVSILEIPTVNEVGLTALALGLLTAGTLLMRRRARSAALRS